jgi:hypothetical protein
MKLTENTKVRIRVPKHLYEAIQAELNKKDTMEEGDEPEETMEEADAQQASVEEVAAAMDKAVVEAKKRAQEIANKKGGKLTQSDFFSVIDKFRSKIKQFGPFKRVAEPEEMGETLDLESLMEAVKDLSKKKVVEAKKKKMTETKDKEKAERFEVIVHKNGKKVSGKDYPSREAANSAFEKASKDLENDVYLNDNIGRHLKTRKGKKKAEAAKKK